MQRMFLFYNVIILFCTMLNAQKPSSQPSGFKVDAVYAWKINVSMSIPSDADGAIVLISKNVISSNLIDGSSYLKGQWIGNAKIAWMGKTGSNAISLKTLDANTKYYIAVYSYKGTSYLTSNPILTNVTTLGSNMGNYYQSITPYNSNFLSQLTALLFNHTMSSYQNFESILIPEFYEKDTVIGGVTMNYVRCDYSNYIQTYLPPFDFANIAIDFNREHILAKNWMNKRSIPNGDLIYYPEGADYHNLALAQGTRVNSKRSDDPLDDVVTVLYTFQDCKQGKNNLNQYCFQPKSDFKGNAARAMLGQMVCYNKSVNNEEWGFLKLGGMANLERQSVMKSWSKADPVDNYEIARHELVFSLQKNRNPFIDHPEWLDCIQFDTLQLLKSCQTNASLLNYSNDSWDVWFQNPVKNVLQIGYLSSSIDPIQIELYSLYGQCVISQTSTQSFLGKNSANIDLVSIQKGYYFLKLLQGGKKFYSKILIE